MSKAKPKTELEPRAVRVAEARRMLVNAATSLRSTLMTHLLDGSERNLDTECGYPTTISADQYHRMYEREGIAKRVVNCMPEECWALDPEIYETEDAEETAFEKAWKALEERHNLLHFMQRLDEMSGIGTFGIMLLGFDDGLELHQPVAGVNETVEWKTSDDQTNNAEEDEVQTPRKLLFVRVFDQSVVTIGTRVVDKASPRFGLPLTYQIRYTDPAGGETLSYEVHWTRIIHAADERRMSEVHGTPRMECVYNRLIDLRKILSGSGEMFWRGAFPGYSFEVNPDLVDQGVEIDAAAMRTEFDNYSNGLQRYLALTGVQAKSLAPQVSSPDAHFKTELQAIAVSMSIPYRVLFGSEEAKLASTQDSKTWNKRVGKRQSKYITPLIVRPTLDRLIAAGILPAPADLMVDWPDLNAPTDEDKAKVTSILTTALKDYVAGGVDQLIPPEIFLQQIMKMSPEEVDAVMEAVEEYAVELEEKKAEEADVQAAALAKAQVAQGVEPGVKPAVGKAAPNSKVPAGVEEQP